jgi:hypothetical protein
VASVLVVEELTGRRRKVTLKGGGLPFQGAGWAGMTSVMTQWNPGNPEATQHVLAPQEMPSSWEGEWNTNRLAPAPCTFSEAGEAEQTLLFANALVEVFDSIRRGGQLLRVTWQEQRTVRLAPTPGALGETGTATTLEREFKVTRVGRLTEFEFNPARMDDIGWSMTFDWAGRGENQRKALDLRGDSLVSATRKSIAEQNAAVSAILADSLRGRRGERNATSAFRLGDLEALADGPRQLMDDFARTANSITNRMKQLGDLIIKVRETPAAIAGQAVDVATNAVSVANQFVDEISREGPEAWSTRNKVSNLTRAAAYYGKSQSQAELVASASERFARTARQRRNSQLARTSRTGSPTTVSDVLAVHVPRDSETLFTISMRYYEADLSAQLARANGLPSYTIHPPTRVPLVIPTRTALEGQQASTV